MESQQANNTQYCKRRTYHAIKNQPSFEIRYKRYPGLRIIDENAIEYLPGWQAKYYMTPAYLNLTQAFHELLIDRCPLNESQYDHARMIWDDLCDKDPECLYTKEEMEMIAHDKEKNRWLLELFKLDKNPHLCYISRPN